MIVTVVVFGGTRYSEGADANPAGMPPATVAGSEVPSTNTDEESKEEGETV